MKKINFTQTKKIIATTLIALFSVFLIQETKAATYYAIASGNWALASTWSQVGCGGLVSATTPGAADDVVICSPYTVTVALPSNITNCTVNTGGTLVALSDLTIAPAGTFTIQAGGTYDHNTVGTAATTIFNGTEAFNATSTIIIDNWSGTVTSLVTGCNSNFGHVTLNWDPGIFYWLSEGLGFTRTILGNFTVGPNCAVELTNVNAAVTFTIGGNLINNGGLIFKYNRNGTTTINVGGSTTMAGVELYGNYLGNGDVIFNGASITATTGTFFLVRDGLGSATLNLTGNFSMPNTGGNGCDFRGVYIISLSSGGTSTFTIGGNLDYQSGIFMVQYAMNNTGATVTLNVTGNVTANFVNVNTALPNGIFRGIGLYWITNAPGYPNTDLFNMHIGGDFTLSGLVGPVDAGYGFSSSGGSGVETDLIDGNMNISGGENTFNATPNFPYPTGHTATVTIGQSLSVSGGDTYLSAFDGTLFGTVNNSVSITGGSLAVKGNDGVGPLNIINGYTQSGGSFFLHKNGSNPTAQPVIVNVNSNNDATGDFSETGTGIINFDDNVNSVVDHIINVYSPNYTIGGTAVMTHSQYGTGGSVYGQLNFARTGTTVYSRSTATHYMQQVKQTVNAVTTVDASATANSFQIASNTSFASIVNNALIVNGILNMAANKITAVGPSLTNYYSGLTVGATGTLRLSNVAGMYDGTVAGTIQPQVFASDVNYRMNWFLDATSTVEYYPAATAVVTGKYPSAGAVVNVTAATLAQYKYGNLKINYLGSAATYIYPTASNVFVRTQLNMLAGRLSLAGSGTGYTITIENPATTGIIRTLPSYISSEYVSGGNVNTAIIQWNAGATNGSYVFPFGSRPAAAVYQIPLTINKTGGNTNMLVSTRATAANTNLPLTSGVTNMYSYPYEVACACAPWPNASIQVVIDRWYDIASATTFTGDVTFSYRGGENTTTWVPTNPFSAQKWSGFWNPPVGLGPPNSTVAATIYAVTATGQTLGGTATPWVLSNNATPLPVDLVYFGAALEKTSAKITWTTASEINCDYYDVEKSTNGKDFEYVTRVKGNGNSTSLINYSTYDNKPYNGKSFYRLKQVDFNGLTDYSRLAPVNNDDHQVDLMYASISNGQMSYSVIAGMEGNYSVSVTDLFGREIFKSDIKLETGVNSNTLSLPGSARSVYFITVTDGNKSFTKKVMSL